MNLFYHYPDHKRQSNFLRGIYNIGGSAVNKIFKIIAYNTDGIWYSGDVYHDENEGVGLGKWKNDVTNSHGIFRSCGAYQYVTYDGDYPTVNTVLRGNCDLEKIKPREEWDFGDIMLTGASIKKYKVVFEKGIIAVGEEK